MERSRSISSQSKREFWRSHLGEWRKSGLSQAEYCRSKGISIKSFGYWKRRLSATGVAVTLVEVPIPRPSIAAFPQRTPLRLRITDTYWIEIQRNFDSDSLHQLLDVLERR